MTPPTKYQCRRCQATFTLESGEGQRASWWGRGLEPRADGVPGVPFEVLPASPIGWDGPPLAVAHRCTELIRSICDQVPEQPDELETLSLDDALAFAAIGLRRAIPVPEKAERAIAVLHKALAWGEAVDHELQERGDALRKAVDEGWRRMIGNEEKTTAVGNRRTIFGVRSILKSAISRDDRWLEEFAKASAKPVAAPETAVRFTGRIRLDGVEVLLHGVGNTGPVPLDLRLDLRRHSPDGFNWGYSGSGPAQLALALLAAYFRVRVGLNNADAMQSADMRALRIYQRFKNRAISTLQQDSPWELSAAQIDAIVTELEADLPPDVAESFAWAVVRPGTRRARAGGRSLAHLVDVRALEPGSGGFDFNARCGATGLSEWEPGDALNQHCQRCEALQLQDVDRDVVESGDA